MLASHLVVSAIQASQRVSYKVFENSGFGPWLTKVSPAMPPALRNLLIQTDRSAAGNAPLFRRIRRGGHVQSGGISGESIRRIVQPRGKAAGIAGLSGHSGRVGMAQSLIVFGASISEVAIAGPRAFRSASAFCLEKGAPPEFAPFLRTLRDGPAAGIRGFGGDAGAGESPPWMDAGERRRGMPR